VVTQSTRYSEPPARAPVNGRTVSRSTETTGAPEGSTAVSDHESSRNAQYWGPKALPAATEFTFYDTQTPGILALTGGTIDVLGQFDFGIAFFAALPGRAQDLERGTVVVTSCGEAFVEIGDLDRFGSGGRPRLRAVTGLRAEGEPACRVPEPRFLVAGAGMDGHRPPAIFVGSADGVVFVGSADGDLYADVPFQRQGERGFEHELGQPGEADLVTGV